MSTTRPFSRFSDFIGNLSVCLFAVLWVLLQTCTAWADTVFFEDDSILIPWPDQVISIPCTPDLQNRYSQSCRQLGADGQNGLVFVTTHDGFALGNLAKFKAHLEDSEKALSTIKSVDVMQSRLISESPVIGLLELERKDSRFSEVEALSQPPIRQSSLIFPVNKDTLVQIFIYLPMEGTNLSSLHADLLDSFIHHTNVRIPQIIPDLQDSSASSTPAQTDSPKPAGILDLLPQALLYGGSVALFVILLLSLHNHLSRKKKE